MNILLSAPTERPPQTPPSTSRSTHTSRAGDHDFGRSGFLVGFSVGPGFMTCEDCDWRPGLGLSFHLGGLIGDRVGLMYDNVGTVVSIDEAIFTLDTMTFAVQSFTGSRGWIKAGAGFAFVSCVDCFSVPIGELGLGLMFGAGGEVVQHGRFAMDVQGRVTVNFFEDVRLYSTVATIGFNWY